MRGCVIDGVVYGDTTVTDVKEINNSQPKVFSLRQNYPNPFNPSTKISFDLSKTTFAVIKIYDLLGKEIETLVNEEMRPGSYSVDFNGEGLSSGIYFYALKTNEFYEIKKMILLR